MEPKTNVLLAHGAWAGGSSWSKVIPPAWKHIPSWYLVATNDQMIPPQAEELMAKRMCATVRQVASSHAAMVSHPEEAADLIELAVQSIGKLANAPASR
jgi:pimeloyl-ACP methyl ester carboxylesterase